MGLQAGGERARLLLCDDDAVELLLLARDLGHLVRGRGRAGARARGGVGASARAGARIRVGVVGQG